MTLHKNQLAAIAMKKKGAYDYSKRCLTTFAKSSHNHNSSLRQVAPGWFVDMTASPMNRAYAYSMAPHLVQRRKKDETKY